MIEKAKRDYLNGMKYKDIAEKYDVSMNTVKSWVTRHGWANLKKGAHKDKKGAHKKDSTCTTETQKEIVTKKIVKEVVANEELTDKQQLFCMYYLKYFNATKAYQKTYRCSYNTANSEGYKLLVNPCIKQQIEKLKTERMEGIYLDGKDILQKYIDIAFADINDFMEFGQEEVPIRDDQGNPLIDNNGEEITVIRNYVNFKNSYEVDGTIISEVSKGKDGVKIKLQDKMKALDFLASHIGLLSQIDKAKIENEKAKTERLQLEIDKISGDNKGKETEDWVKAIEQIAAKRRGKDG